MYLKPQFTVLLQNNDAPAEKTILEVAESLKVPLNELREIEKEIQRLNELMEIMNAKRRSIQKIIDDHNVILAPARRLPQDVLHEIFLNCLPTHRNPNVEFSESPLLLTRICSSWRAIALSSPRMWSKVHIVLPRFSSGDTARRQRFADAVLLKCNILRKWLGQSGTFPLSLSITHPGACAMEYEPARAMFNLLLSFADRWSDVQLSMSEDVYHKLQGKMDPTKFSSLKSLDITLHTKYYGNNVHSPPIQLLAAPNLCRLAISAIWTTLRMTRNLVQPIWNNITHITLSSITDKYLPLLLKKSYNLVFGDFRVNPSPWDAEPLVDQEETPLPRLESLSIDDSGAQETMDALFNAIKAPALSKLSYRWSYPSGIHDDDDPSMPLPAPVIPLLKNSALISNLLLDGYLSSKDTQECLRHAAGVTHVAFGKPLLRVGDGLLHMDSDTPPDNFDLRILCVGSSGVTPLPRLESLEAYQLSSLTDDDLLDLITSRINASLRGETAALKFIKIDFLRRRQKDITEEVSRLAKEAGIEVKLDSTYTAATS
ncbi:hypothetical protein M413DRAFT_149619, partial [Hebeloma cylindrosporum]